jgi:hypothetical protein
MADNWSDWYSGAMAPPLSLPGGGYAPAPSVQTPSSVEDLYRGIYGSPAPSLSSVSRPTVPVNPATGMPYATTANASMSGGPGIGYGAQGSVRYSPPTAPVYQPNGTVVANKDQSRLPVVPAGLPLNVPTGASARGQLGAGGFGSGSLTASMPSKTPDVINLSAVPMSEVSAQNTANSFGKPVRFGNGKTYYPTDTPISGVRAPMKPVGNAPALPAQQQRGGLLSLFGSKGGILSTLFGGGNNAAPMSFGTSTGSAVSPGLGYNAAYSQTSTGDGQGNNAFSSGDGFWGGARSLTE